LEKLYRALTLCRVILREKPYQDIGIQACHLHTLNLQR
jgi:ribosomal protein S14